MDITCPSCHTLFSYTASKTPKFCPFCQAALTPSAQDSLQNHTETTLNSDPIALVEDQLPENDSIQFSIGPYQIIKSIGKGGMGEVFLAYDTSCGRRIALKRIRPDLIEHTKMHFRFLKEARITSQLTHPSIIPIYTIHSEKDLLYYTMPYVEGQTLKQVLLNAKQFEKKGHKPDHASSIPALIRLFLSICQAVAYAHSKGIIHRDLKPNNIIIGRYGEALILDWGLAKQIAQLDEHQEDLLKDHDALKELTILGKVVGTVAYIAPELAVGQPASFQTDIYSLGVTLYQILTLYHPFNRKSLADFRKTMKNEQLIPPAEIAPHRDVPPILSRIVLKCLSPSLETRYSNINDLIHDLEIYIEGRSEWFKTAELDIHKKSDWEFQENVLIAEHMAITRGTDVSDWVNMMISKFSFSENIKIEAKVRLGERGNGLGFLLSVPEAAERTHLNNGYCLWIASDENKSTKLLRSTVEVTYAPDVFLQRDIWYQIRIEKIENNIYFYLNDTLQFSYISHLPLSGTHVGLLARDADFTLEDFSVFVGNQSIKVNCLAVPDAFLAHKDYNTALTEYRRIGYAFPGTAEGREALFRAGVTLLEEARACLDPEAILKKSEEALEEFHKLYGTHGAPLEYLGKALVYQAMGDYEEEIKCYELAYRRYQNHALLPILYEQMIFRMHDSSRNNRKATYQFILLAVRFIPTASLSYNAKKLFDSLKRHWEPLYFIDNEGLSQYSEGVQNRAFAIQLAFWLAKPLVLAELIDELIHYEPVPIQIVGNALFALIELGSHAIAAEKFAKVKKEFSEESHVLNLIDVLISANEFPLELTLNRLFEMVPHQLGRRELSVVLNLMISTLQNQNPQRVHDIAKRLFPHDLPSDGHLRVDVCKIWAALMEKRLSEAEELLHRYSLEQLTQEGSYLHFLYGCWLFVTEGKEIASIHFSSILDVTYPRSWTLFGHYFYGRPEDKKLWLQRAFLWEKRHLYRQFALFYSCKGDVEKAKQYHELSLQQYVE